VIWTALCPILINRYYNHMLSTQEIIEFTTFFWLPVILWKSLEFFHPIFSKLDNKTLVLLHVLNNYSNGQPSKNLVDTVTCKLHHFVSQLCHRTHKNTEDSVGIISVVVIKWHVPILLELSKKNGSNYVNKIKCHQMGQRRILK